MRKSFSGLLLGILAGLVFWSLLFIFYQSMAGKKSTNASMGEEIPAGIQDNGVPLPSKDLMEGEESTQIVDWEIFLQRLDDIRFFLPTNPEVAIEVLYDEMGNASSDLEVAAELLLIAEAETYLGRPEEAGLIYHDVVSMIEPILDELDSSVDLAQAYGFLISANISLENVEEAQAYYTDLDQIMDQRSSSLKDPLDIQMIFMVMIDSSLLLGDYQGSENYFSEMEAAYWAEVEIQPGSIETLKLCVELIVASNSLYHFDKAEEYSRILSTALIDELNHLSTLEDYVSWIEISKEITSFIINTSFINERDLVLETISDMVISASDSDLLIRANRILGDAEFENGNYQFAAVYYKRLYMLSPTTDNLYLTAIAYFAGGNNGCAYYWFNLLLEQNDPRIGFYSELANRILHQLEESYGEMCSVCLTCPDETSDR